VRIKDGRQNFIGLWIRRVLEGEPFEVWGGEQLRDLTYVDDVVAAMIAAAESDATAGRALNIGGFPAVSLLQLAERLTAVGDGARYVVKEFPAEQRAIDIGSYEADDHAFRAATGWAPQVGIAEGLGRTLAYYRRHLADYL
jgi:UDP-glucose 4-epimerase